MPDNNDHVTKKDLLEAVAALDQSLIEMRDMQTEMLRAFQNWAKPSEIKLRSQAAEITALEERISLLETRLYDAERGYKHQ